MSGFEKDFAVKVEKEEYEVIPNVDVKQEFVDVNVNTNHQYECNESFWKKKCEVLERKVSRFEKENAALKAKKFAPSKPSTPYSDPLLKAFFCPKLPEEELAELRQEKKDLIAKLTVMKDENVKLGFLISTTLFSNPLRQKLV